MIWEIPFDVIFTTVDGKESLVESWTRGVSMGYPYFESALGDMKFSIQTHKDGQWYLKIANMGVTAVTGFAGVRFPWKFGEDSYTLIPGIYYDGNYHEFQKNIPVIHLPEKPRFAASVSAFTYPTVLA